MEEKREERDMNIIEFDRDYDKLHCRINDLFATIRRANEENVEKFKEGKTFLVKIEGRDSFYARLFFVINIGELKTLPSDFILYDINGTIVDVNRFYERYADEDSVLVLILQKISETPNLSWEESI